MSGDIKEQAPATAPAPAVCVWTLTNWTPDDSWYRTPHGELSRFKSNGGMCIECGKPIKFTEAK